MIYIFSRNVFSINHYVLVIKFFSADGYTTTTSENKNLLRTPSAWIVKKLP